jgi:hypothetical protein
LKFALDVLPAPLRLPQPYRTTVFGIYVLERICVRFSSWRAILHLNR